MQSETHEKRLIGRIEKVLFPDWNLPPMDGKVDTGAFTSSLHCLDIELKSELKLVGFSVPLPDRDDPYRLEANVHDVRRIKSSNGMVEERVIVITTIRIGRDDYKIELSLTDRSDMKHPVLLGRRFLKHKFLVDVSKTYLAGESWRDVR